MHESKLLVIPFYKGDRGQVDRLGTWMQRLSKGQKVGHKLMFYGTSNADMEGIGNNFVGLFDEMTGSKQVLTPNLQPNERTWPKTCNFQFVHLAKYIAESRPDISAFYYFEPDNLPLVPGWLDTIYDDYDKQKSLYYGVGAPNIDRGKSSGMHMIGTGMYPQDVWHRLKTLHEVEQKQPNIPWDVYMRDEANPATYYTKLIFNLNGTRGFREEPDGRHTAICFKPPEQSFLARREVEDFSEAVVFHGCKDASLRLVIGKRLGIEQPEPLTYVHAGDLGDVIYALRSIKERGPGILKFSERGAAREKLTPDRIGLLKPLLENQEYLTEIHDHHDEGFVDFDFRPFRNIHVQHGNLVDDQADWVGLPRGLGNDDQPWVTAPYADKKAAYVINRTARYRNDKFPWKKIDALNLDALFIGTFEEYKEFNLLMSIPYEETATLLDVAIMIKGSKFFIGNQSVCFAIAEAMRHPRIQETCLENKDCIFTSSTGIYYQEGSFNFHMLGKKPVKPVSDENSVGQFNLEEVLAHPKLREMIDELVTTRIDALLK